MLSKEREEIKLLNVFNLENSKSDSEQQFLKFLKNSNDVLIKVEFFLVYEWLKLVEVSRRYCSSIL